MSFWCISLTCLRWLVFVQDDIIINNVFNMEHLCFIFAMLPVRSIKNVYTVYNITLDKYQPPSNTTCHTTKKCTKHSFKAKFIRRILVASNAIKTTDNEMINLISFVIYCLNCIRRDRNSTYKTCLIYLLTTRICT